MQEHKTKQTQKWNNKYLKRYVLKKMNNKCTTIKTQTKKSRPENNLKKEHNINRIIII